jgi:hypothetical protein
MKITKQKVGNISWGEGEKKKIKTQSETVDKSRPRRRKRGEEIAKQNCLRLKSLGTNYNQWLTSN